MATIGIFPASGGLGTSTYTHLLRLVPAGRVVLINRFPDKVPRAHVDAGVRVRRASYESSPDELQRAFAGLDVLFLISYPDFVHEYRVQVQLPAVDAARRAGVRHIFYSSLAFAGDLGDASKATVMQAHLDTERHLASLAARDPDFSFTSVREGLYAESTPIYTAFFRPKQSPTSEIAIPHDGSAPGVAWAKRDELGEATARLIAQYAEDPAAFPYRNAKVLLTGPRAWTLDETVRVLGAVAGVPDLRIRRVSVDEYARLPQVLARFGSEAKAKSWATAWEAIRDGETAVVTGDLERILGRKPAEFDDVVRELYK